MFQQAYLTYSRSVYFTGSGQFLGMFSGLARTLVSDLRLDRPCWYPSLGPVVEDTSIRSNEKRRAVLGCFALTTKYVLSHGTRSSLC